MSYEHYNIEDFLADEGFRTWVLSPDDNGDVFWTHWMETHPTQKATILSAREVLLSLKYKEAEQVSESERSELLKSILQHQEPSDESKTRFVSNRVLAIAASIVLLIAVGGIMISTLMVQDDEPVVKVIEPIFRENPKGSKSVVHLADGSKVHLNANSSLKYYNNYLEKRYIELTGEAYFEVEKNPENPFIVKSGNIYTTALGTSFNVSTKGEAIEVTLVEGIVDVYEESHPNDKRLLSPMERVEYHSAKGLSATSEIRSLDVILWTKGILHFDQTPIPEVVQQLEDWYGVEIDIEGDYRNLSFSSEYKDEYLTNILHTMSFSLNMEYTIEDKYVKLKFN